MNLSIRISPCPNDTFAFDAMLNGRVDSRGYSFHNTFEDIEQLNAAALATLPDICKVSYAVIPQISLNYALMDSGSALGRGNGPLLVCHEALDTSRTDLRVAIPGVNTTANMLLSRLFPNITDKPVYLFSDIADAVSRGECDAGVLIHEGRFTYAARGLMLAADLGLLWEEHTHLPLPLGAIVVRRSLSMEVKGTVEQIIRDSVAFAMAHPEASVEFVRDHARELSPAVTRSHIDMFVNEHTLSLGSEGRRAVCRLTGMRASEIFL